METLILSWWYSVGRNNWYCYFPEVIFFKKNLFMQTLVKFLAMVTQGRTFTFWRFNTSVNIWSRIWQETPSWVFHFSTPVYMHLRFNFRPHFNIWRKYWRVAKSRVWLMSCSLTCCSQAGKLARNALFHELLYLFAPDYGEYKNSLLRGRGDLVWVNW